MFGIASNFRLVFANVLRAQAARSTIEASRKIFNYPDVTAYGNFSVITVLEFLQHQFTKMGHGDPLVTQTYLNQQATTAPFSPPEASAAGAATSKRANRRSEAQLEERTGSDVPSRTCVENHRARSAPNFSPG